MYFVCREEVRRVAEFVWTAVPPHDRQQGKKARRWNESVDSAGAAAVRAEPVAAQSDYVLSLYVTAR